MIRIAPVILLAAGSLLLAQQPSQNSPGGWRHVGDPPAAGAPAASDNSAPNPEPVAPDQYGQQSTQQPAPNGQPDDAVTTPAPTPEPMPPQPPPQGATAQPGGQPAYGLPREMTVKPGTYVTVRINQPLSSDRNHEGDPFTATLMQPVVADGVVVAQRGQTVYGRVAEAEKAHMDKPSRLKLELTGLTLADGTQAPVQSQLLTRQGGSTPGGVQAGTVAGTTIIGGAVGGAAAWGTGAAIGAGVGAAAGIIGVLVTRHHPTVVYPEAVLTFQITSPVTVSTERAPQAFRYVGPEDYQQAPQFASRPGPRPAGPGGYYAPGYGYPYAAYPGYPYYGYPYWGYPYYPYGGPGIGLYWGRGYWGGGFRRWR